MNSTGETSITNTDNYVFLFKCIVSFIHDLNEMYGETQKSLQLYDLLMEKTGIVHQEPIKKHINVFTNFVVENEESILEKNAELLKLEKIEYNDKVFINMKEIFNIADGDSKAAIWEHLMTLSAVLNPTSKAKQILMEQKAEKTEKGESSSSEDFLTNIIKKVSDNITPDTASDPSSMMSNLMSSGLFGELIEDMNNGISNGDIDLGQMMNSLQGVMSNLSGVLEEVNKK